MEISPNSCSKTNNKILDLVMQLNLKGKKVLDLGAGQGYFTKLLYDALHAKGLTPDDIITASDYSPQDYKFDRIPCQFGDFNVGLPYEDDTFDVVCCIEVIEHIEDQFKLMREIKRILKPGGMVFITTPNIMNINSRIMFLGYGLYPLFDVLSVSGDKASLYGHIHPISYYYFSYIARRTGFKNVQFSPDKIKRSSVFLIIFTYPIIWIMGFSHKLSLKRKKPETFLENLYELKTMNSFSLLTSRTIILTATKNS
jgi:ubiquinone/menaquinone biosynthesis C-methylase UbiE